MRFKQKSDVEKLQKENEELQKRLDAMIDRLEQETEEWKQKNLEEIDENCKILESYCRQIANFRDFQSIEILAQYTGNPGVYSLYAREARLFPGMRQYKNLGFCGLLYCEDLENVTIRIHSPHFGIEIAIDEWLAVYTGEFDDLQKAVKSEVWTTLEETSLMRRIYSEIRDVYDCARRCKYKYDSKIAETYNFKIKNFLL